MSASLRINAVNKDQIMQAAYRHILANPSDPFIRNRVMSHIASGIAGMHFDEQGNRTGPSYDATPIVVRKTIQIPDDKGNLKTLEWDAVEYRDQTTL